jgi:hypothetical protein
MVIKLTCQSIDYDALALAPTNDSSIDFDQTRFSVNDEYIVNASKQLADKLRKVKCVHKFYHIH